jgi:hypothetical protein
MRALLSVSAQGTFPRSNQGDHSRYCNYALQFELGRNHRKHEKSPTQSLLTIQSKLAHDEWNAPCLGKKVDSNINRVYWQQHHIIGPEKSLTFCFGGDENVSAAWRTQKNTLNMLN